MKNPATDDPTSEAYYLRHNYLARRPPPGAPHEDHIVRFLRAFTPAAFG